MPKEYWETGAEKDIFIPGAKQEAGAYSDYYQQQEELRVVPMSAKDKRIWTNLFQLFDLAAPYIDDLDAQSGTEVPPDYINEPWRFESKNVFKIWPNYAAMRKEYQEAGQTLIEEYEKTIKAGTPEGPDIELVGLGYFWTVVIVAAVITVFSVCGAIYQVYKAKEAEMNAEEKKHLTKFGKKGAEVAIAVGATWPYAISKLADALKYGLVAIALIMTLQYLQKGDD